MLVLELVCAVTYHNHTAQRANMIVHYENRIHLHSSLKFIIRRVISGNRKKNIGCTDDFIRYFHICQWCGLQNGVKDDDVNFPESFIRLNNPYFR